jgi:xanthosine utilization system XapX-like protein
MRDRDYARRSGVTLGEYVAATAVILVGFLALLVFVAHPALTTAAVVGLTIGVASGRIARKVRRLVCRVNGECRECRPAADPSESGLETV